MIKLAMLPKASKTLQKNPSFFGHFLCFREITFLVGELCHVMEKQHFE